MKICVVGAGNWGINHIRIYNSLQVLASIVEINPEKRKTLVSNFPNVKILENLEDVLQDPEIDAIAITTPAKTHYEIAKQVLLSKKDCFVEKPVSLFSVQAKELTKLAKDQNKILMVGHILLYHPAILKIKELIKNGKLGKIQYLYSNRLHLGTVRKEENSLWSFAPHDVSVIQFLLESLPTSVSAFGGCFLQPKIDDVTLTTMEFPENVKAHIHVSWLHPFKEHRLVVIGDKSMVVFEDSKEKDKLILYQKGIDWVKGEPIKREADFITIDFEKDEPLLLEIKEFLHCLKTRKNPLSDGKNGVEVLTTLEQAQKSLDFRKPETELLPPAKNYFVHQTVCVDENVKIGEGTKIWHFSHVQSGAVIGKNCSFGQNVNIGNNVKIGNSVKIQNNVSVYEGVTLEDFVFCGPSMVFTNVLNPRCKFPQKGGEFYTKTLVKEGASLGANCTIVCGVTVGKGAFVGAGAVVSKDVPDFALVLGVPAKFVSWVCECGAKLKFQNSKTSCQKCQKSYEKLNEQKIIQN